MSHPEIERILNGPGTPAEKGEAASRFVAGLPAARRQQKDAATKSAFRPKGTRLPDDWIFDPVNLWIGGYERYMLDRERKIIDEARQRIAEERPLWRQYYMEMLEQHLEHATDPDLVAGLRRELRKVRRALGLIKPTPETIRAQTRERVRRHREREKKRAAKRSSR